jgi:hypothetical protein
MSMLVDIASSSRPQAPVRVATQDRSGGASVEEVVTEATSRSVRRIAVVASVEWADGSGDTLAGGAAGYSAEDLVEVGLSAPTTSPPRRAARPRPVRNSHVPRALLGVRASSPWWIKRCHASASARSARRRSAPGSADTLRASFRQLTVPSDSGEKCCLSKSAARSSIALGPWLPPVAMGSHATAFPHHQLGGSARSVAIRVREPGLLIRPANPSPQAANALPGCGPGGPSRPPPRHSPPRCPESLAPNLWPGRTF